MKESNPYNLTGANDSNLAILYSLLVMALATLLVIHIIRMWDRAHYEIHSHEYKNGKVDYYIAEKCFNLFFAPIHGVYASEFEAHSKLIDLQNARLKAK